MKKYIATKKGFAGRLIEKGEVFEYEGKPGKWMKEYKKEVIEKSTQKEKSSTKKGEKRANDKEVI